MGAATKPRPSHNYFLNGSKEAWGYRFLKVFDAARRSRPVARVAYPFSFKQSLPVKFLHHVISFNNSFVV